MKSHERMQTYESRRSSEETPSDISFERELAAEEMYASRAGALERLAAHIDETLYKALAQKIEHERAILIDLGEREEKVAAKKRRLDKVLRTEYFAYRTLDINAL